MATSQNPIRSRNRIQIRNRKNLHHQSRKMPLGESFQTPSHSGGGDVSASDIASNQSGWLKCLAAVFGCLALYGLYFLGSQTLALQANDSKKSLLNIRIWTALGIVTLCVSFGWVFRSRVDSTPDAPESAPAPFISRIPILKNLVGPAAKTPEMDSSYESFHWWLVALCVVLICSLIALLCYCFSEETIPEPAKSFVDLEAGNGFVDLEAGNVMFNRPRNFLGFWPEISMSGRYKPSMRRERPRRSERSTLDP